MTEAEKKAYKAKQLRYKKPIAGNLNIETIQSEFHVADQKGNFGSRRPVP